MGRLTASPPILAALAALALSACGSSGDADLLPGSTASQITSNLDEVERLVAEEECIGAENSAAEIATQVEELTGVDAKLKQALAEGVGRLSETVATECEETEEEGEEEEFTAPEPEEEEEPEKQKPEKPEKEKEGKEEEPASEEPEGPELPPPSNGKGEEKGKGEGPPEETGGVGPGGPAEGE